MEMLSTPVEQYSWVLLLVASGFLVISAFSIIKGITVRRKLSHWRKITGAVTAVNSRFEATVEWTVRGTTYTQSPMSLFALRKGERINLLLDPRWDSAIKLDIWTHNGAIWLYTAAVLGTIGLLLGFFTVLFA